jgi:hypothetical protein
MTSVEGTYKIFMLFEFQQRKWLLSGFSAILTECQLVKKSAAKRILSRLSSKFTKIMKCVNWMIMTGRINITQRGFLRWKLKVFPISSPHRPIFSNIDKIACIRSITTISNHHQHFTLLKFFPRWSFTTKYSHSFKLGKNQSNCNFALNSLIKKIKSFLERYRFNKWKHATIKFYSPNVKACFVYLNKVFLSKLLLIFAHWKVPEYYYEEYCEEIVSESQKTTKKFAVMVKPCTLFEYFDNRTYDPAFRAVFRSLGYFVKRRLKEYFKNWKNLMKIELESIENFTIFSKEEQKEHEKIANTREKLSKVTEIKRRLNNTVDAKDLKHANFELLILQEQIRSQKLKNAIFIWQQFGMKESNLL